MARYKQLGIGLLEILLALAVIAILLGTATRYFHTTRDTQRVNDAMNILQSIHHAGAQYFIDRGDMAKNLLVEFNDRGFIPKQFLDKTANPWGGDISVKGHKDSIDVTLANIPKALCENIREKVNQKMEDLIEKDVAPCSSTGGGSDQRGSLTVTFVYGV